MLAGLLACVDNPLEEFGQETVESPAVAVFCLHCHWQLQCVPTCEPDNVTQCETLQVWERFKHVQRWTEQQVGVELVQPRDRQQRLAREVDRPRLAPLYKHFRRTFFLVFEYHKLYSPCFERRFPFTVCDVCKELTRGTSRKPAEHRASASQQRGDFTQGLGTERTEPEVAV